MKMKLMMFLLPVTLLANCIKAINGQQQADTDDGTFAYYYVDDDRTSIHFGANAMPREQVGVAENSEQDQSDADYNSIYPPKSLARRHQVELAYMKRHMGSQFSAEQVLYHKLLGKGTKYLKSIRPTKRHTDMLEIEIGMSVMMIEDLVERDQLMVMAAAIKMKWSDVFLSWNPSEFDNITWIAIASSEIWIPDVAIVNSPYPYELTRKLTTVDVDNKGTVGYFPSGYLKTRCSIHIEYFPFDSQHCEVLFESWIYPAAFLKFVPYSEGNVVDIKEYYTNHQWALIHNTVSYQTAVYDGKNFSQMTFTFILQRKSQYYFMYFIFPQFLLAFLQTLSHCLPVEHPGRMTMLTSLFIGTSVTQSAVANSIPKSSDAQSLLQIYMTIMSINLAVGLLISTIILYIVLRFPNEPPSLTAIFLAVFSVIWPGDENDGRKVISLQERLKKRSIGKQRSFSTAYIFSPNSIYGTHFDSWHEAAPIEESRKRHTLVEKRKLNDAQHSESSKNSKSCKPNADEIDIDNNSLLKRDWLVYCVALDKTIMYIAATWNILVPTVLFIIIPFTRSDDHYR